MKASRECTNRANCVIDLLSVRKDDSRDPIWNPFLTIGQRLCANQEWEKAQQSFKQAMDVAEVLVRTRDKHANRIKASAFTCIGALLYCRGAQMGGSEDLSRAHVYLRRGMYIFHSESEKYGEAISLCALGQVFQLQKKWNEVFLYYESAQLALSSLEDEPNAIHLRYEITRRLDNALKQWHRESIGDDVDLESQDSSRDQTEETDTRLEFLPIFSEIRAGDPRAIAKNVSGYVETDHLIINDKYYYVSNTQGLGLRLAFSPAITYVAQSVRGDSMNIAGIQEGDYIILRMSTVAGLPLDAQDGDIVAVDLPLDERGITLKRFIKRERKIAFTPESTNPEHKSWEFDIGNDFSPPFRIVGTLVAVLKPL